MDKGSRQEPVPMRSGYIAPLGPAVQPTKVVEEARAEETSTSHDTAGSHTQSNDLDDSSLNLPSSISLVEIGETDLVDIPQPESAPAHPPGQSYYLAGPAQPITSHQPYSHQPPSQALGRMAMTSEAPPDRVAEDHIYLQAGLNHDGAQSNPHGPDFPPEQQPLPSLTPPPVYPVDREFRPPQPSRSYRVAPPPPQPGDDRYPTISELILPPGVHLSIHEINAEAAPKVPRGPKGPSHWEIDEHILARYRAEAERRRLEEEVHGREILLEQEKQKDRIVAGLDNNDLNALVRSFDKHVQDVHACPPPYDGHIPPGLDLFPSPDEDFSVHKFNAALERFYASIVVGVLRVVHEIQRIRNWEEGHRTVVAMTVYTYAWWCDLIFTAIFAFLSLLIFFPSSRTHFFLSSVHVSSPMSSLGEEDLVKIAEKRQDNPWGPAASESKATRWSRNVQDIVQSFSSPRGGDEQATEVARGVQEKVEVKLQKDMEQREHAGNSDEGDAELSRRKKAIKMYAQPGLRFIGGLSDKWERIANALSPAPGYMLQARPTEIFLFLAAPPMVVSTFVPAWMFAKTFGAIFGLILFAQPLLNHIISELDHNVPDWKERLVLEYNILETVPTNSQLVLRLLRNAEHHNHPIPPAPLAEDLGEDASEGSDAGSRAADQGTTRKMMQGVQHAGGKVKKGTRATMRQAWDKIGRAKEETFGVITGHRELDAHGKAEHAMEKMHINIEGNAAQKLLTKLPSAQEPTATDPSVFYVRHGKHGPGHIIIHPPVDVATPARIEFTTVRNVPAESNVAIDPRDEPVKGHLVVPVNDIVGLKKIGLNLPARTAVGWALDAEGAGGVGLEVTVVKRDMDEAVRPFQHAGLVEETPAQGKEEVIKFTGIVRRNELFDRLIAIGDQRWEMN